jgi:hypothetical protein
MIDVSGEGGAVIEDPAIHKIVVSGNSKLRMAIKLTFKFSRCKTYVRQRASASVSSNDAIPISSTSSSLLIDWDINNDLPRNYTVPIASTSSGFFVDGGLDSDVLAFGEKEDGGERIHLF